MEAHTLECVMRKANKSKTFREEFKKEKIRLATTKKKKVQKVEAWALIDEMDGLATAYNHPHSVFMPRIYTSYEEAQKVSETVITEGKHLQVVLCEITYHLK